MKNTEDISHYNHDLRNDIGVAITFLELLKLDQPQLVENECVVAALEALTRANELSQDIAMVCKRVGVEEEDDASSLVKLAVKEHVFSNIKPSYDRLRKMFPQITINDTYQVIDEEKYLYLELSSLSRFRENIVSNAVKAKATRLDIKHEMRDNYAIITYSDNGVGMSSDEIDKLMLSQHGDGVIHGVGTKSMLKIAHMHHVYLTYSSEEGKGTTIRAIIPYATE